jgi:DNA-nicking Smr family endonuclease
VPETRRELPPLTPGENPAGLDRRSAERMKKGEMVIDGRLDLHGLTQDLAHAELLAFIGRAWDAGRRCVLVITGKGGRPGPGILKAQVPRWLNQSPLRERVLGFSHARPKDGGDGALYVLIRRRR